MCCWRNRNSSECRELLYPVDKCGHILASYEDLFLLLEQMVVVLLAGLQRQLGGHLLFSGDTIWSVNIVVFPPLQLLQVLPTCFHKPVRTILLGVGIQEVGDLAWVEECVWFRDQPRIIPDDLRDFLAECFMVGDGAKDANILWVGGYEDPAETAIGPRTELSARQA